MKYEITVGEVKTPNSNVRGYASVVFGDSFKVSNITILEGRDNQLYISMPHYAKSGDGERKDICYPATKEFRRELEANILLALENLQQTGEKKYLVGDKQDMELPFTVAVTPFEKENSSIRGLARMYIADCFAVSNISLIMGKNGLFVSMPSYKTNQIDENNRSVYRDICYPVTGEFRGKLNTLMTDAYEKAAAEVQEQIRGQELVSMKEDTISWHVKDSLKKAADAMQKQCDSLKQQVTQLKEKICNKAGKIVDAAKRNGKRALYKITQITGMRKKLDAIKNKVDHAINRMDNLEKAVGECQGQQERGSRAEALLPDCVVAEPQPEYGAELFEKYQREHGKDMVQAAR